MRTFRGFFLGNRSSRAARRLDRHGPRWDRCGLRDVFIDRGAGDVVNLAKGPRGQGRNHADQKIAPTRSWCTDGRPRKILSTGFLATRTGCRERTAPQAEIARDRIRRGRAFHEAVDAPRREARAGTRTPRSALAREEIGVPFRPSEGVLGIENRRRPQPSMSSCG